MNILPPPHSLEVLPLAWSGHLAAFTIPNGEAHRSFSLIEANPALGPHVTLGRMELLNLADWKHITGSDPVLPRMPADLFLVRFAFSLKPPKVPRARITIAELTMRLLPINEEEEAYAFAMAPYRVFADAKGTLGWSFKAWGVELAGDREGGGTEVVTPHGLGDPIFSWTLHDHKSHRLVGTHQVYAIIAARPVGGAGVRVQMELSAQVHQEHFGFLTFGPPAEAIAAMRRELKPA